MTFITDTIKSAALTTFLLGIFPVLPAGAQGDITFRDLTIQQKPLATLAAPRSELKVRAWTGRRDATYAPGDSVTLYVETNRDAYITVLDVGTSGRTHVIFPNKHKPDNFVPANQIVEIPGENADYRLRVGGPAGRELIKVFASERPLGLIPKEELQSQGAFQTYRGDAETLTRDLGIALNRPEAVIATATTSFKIVPRRTTDERPAPHASTKPAAPIVAPAAASVEAPSDGPDDLFQRAESVRYGEGSGGIPNVLEALRLYTAAADAGHVQAMVRIGRLHEDGKVLDRNYRLAIEWYRRGAERGSTQAMVRLARMYALGVGVAKEVPEAVRWLQQAAGQGDGLAMQSLARMHDEGFGVAKDPDAAASFVIRALKAGAWTAIDQAAKLSEESRIALQKALREAKVYDGPIDGVIGPATRTALSETGRLG